MRIEAEQLVKLTAVSPTHKTAMLHTAPNRYGQNVPTLEPTRMQMLGGEASVLALSNAEWRRVRAAERGNDGERAERASAAHLCPPVFSSDRPVFSARGEKRNYLYASACRPPIPPLGCVFSFFLFLRSHPWVAWCVF